MGMVDLLKGRGRFYANANKSQSHVLSSHNGPRNDFMPTPTDLRRQSHNGPRTNFMPTPTNLKRSQSHNGPRNDFMLLSARLGSPAVALISSISLMMQSRWLRLGRGRSTKL